MIHKRVFEECCMRFPIMTENSLWFPCGYNRIRIRSKTDGLFGMTEFIFEYHSQDSWKLETMKLYLAESDEKAIKGRVRNSKRSKDI